MTIENSDFAGFPPNPVDRPGYRLEFNDDFTEPVLDTNKWLPYYLPQWSSRELAAARYALKGSALRLLIEEDQQPWCPDHDGAVRVSSLQTGCYSGPLITDDFHRDSLEIDAASYHVYTAEWTPTQVEFFVDNLSLRTLPQSPKYPMQFM